MSKSQSIDTDVMMAAAKRITGLYAHLLRPEEQRQLFDLTMEQLRAAFTTRDFLLERLRQRLNPLTPGEGQ